MTIEAASLAQVAGQGQEVLSSTGSDAAQSFNAALERATARQDAAAAPNGDVFGALFDPLLQLGEHSERLATYANPSLSNEFRPGELLQITMQSHQFLFHCELVANVANRASDGVQQLFRQQN